MMEENNTGKVFSSAGQGRFEFENAGVGLTPDQQAEQGSQNPKKKHGII